VPSAPEPPMPLNLQWCPWTMRASRSSKQSRSARTPMSVLKRHALELIPGACAATLLHARLFRATGRNSVPRLSGDASD